MMPQTQLEIHWGIQWNSSIGACESDSKLIMPVSMVLSPTPLIAYECDLDVFKKVTVRITEPGNTDHGEDTLLSRS